MRHVHPKKLLNSKWTAVSPENGEKHFVITAVEFDEDGRVEECRAEAIMSRRVFSIDWRSLNDNEMWVQGWQ